MNKNCLLTIVCIAFFCSCNTKDQNESRQGVSSNDTIENTSLESISVLYYNYIFLSEVPIYPQDIELSIPSFKSKHPNGVLDAEITDPKVLDEVSNLVQQSETDSLTRQNLGVTRIVAQLKYKNGEKDTLAIEGIFSDEIFLNGKARKTNNRLLYLLKNNIGFYPWIIGDDLRHMKELQDNSFMKEPFVASQYYKTWQKIRSQE